MLDKKNILKLIFGEYMLLFFYVANIFVASTTPTH